MRKFQTILFAVLTIAGLMTSANVSADDSRWKGSKFETVLASGEEFFLYNVGTGKFVINGGDWGVEGRLFYDNFGKSLTFTTVNGNNLIYSATVTGASTACYFGLNVPCVTGITGAGGSWGDAVAAALMDANANYTGKTGKNGTQYSGNRNWTFERISGETDDTENAEYTYYMSETLKGLTTGQEASTQTPTTYYLGAAWGMNLDPNAENNSASGKREVGQFVFIDDDRTTFATATAFNANKTTICKIFDNTTNVSGDLLYQWKIVTRTEFEKQITSSQAGQYGGISTNVSYRIFDQDMSRNDVRFFDSEKGWVVKEKSGQSYATSDGYRFRFTYGLEGMDGSYFVWHQNGGTTQGEGWDDHTVKNENYQRDDYHAWNYPVRLKEQWNGTKDAKFGFLSFEGIGTVSTYIDAPAQGWYQITCYGFCESEANDNRGYLFASINNATSGDGYATTPLKRVAPGFFNTLDYSVAQEEDKSYGATRTSDKKYHYCEAAGNFLTDNPTEYSYILLVHASSPGDKIYFGVGKDKASRGLDTEYDSRRYVSGGYRYYYHDKDWIGVDNFQITYLGEDYVDFDEDKESLNYLKNEDETDKQYTNKSTRLKRTFKANSWNSFVFPLDMTAVQVRQAFGDGTKLAVLDGLGTLSGKASVIDFKVLELPADGIAVEKGKFYLIKPQKDPNADGFYNLGRGTFNTADFPEIAEVAVNIKEGLTHTNKAKSKATYVRTKNYDNFDKNNPTEPFVKAYREEGGIAYGSYVIGANNGDDQTSMFVVKNNMRIKGFRGWIEDVALGSQAKVSFDGIFDETDDIEFIPTSEPQSVTQDSSIYDLSGRKVSANADRLPKGIYIVNGKKFIVK